MACGASKLDVAETAVTKNMASDADLHFILSVKVCHRHLKYFLNSDSPCGSEADARII